MIDAITSYSDKPSARAYFLELRKRISEVTRQDLDKALFSNTVATSTFIETDVILCYYPVRGEPNVLPLAIHALELGKTVAFPVSHIKERQLTFHPIKNLSDLTTGAYKIPEPSKTLPMISDFSNTLCIVPALAFNKNGKRLGYGGGYYDRFLSSFNGTSVGLVYSQFYADHIPTDPHDAAVDIIITENGGYISREKKK